MLTFRLKYLFCLVLVIGVALMWALWYKPREVSANDLLVARRESLQLKHPATIDECLEAMGLRDKVGERVAASSYHIDSYLNSDCYRLNCDWHEELMFCYVFESPFQDQAGKNARVRWQISNDSWQAIEDKARDEDWIFQRQMFVTIAVGLFMGWVVWPRRTAS